ncbi:DUF6916 family protein [Pseudomonas sp. NY15437]|uniref:DUF6916 family protein n=1 Tax=Pseudomonas sp. NY15437 TaxID=3400360 RepID=UPI003A89696A
MYSMPTQQDLQQAQGTLFQLWVAPDQALDVELIEVLVGNPMSAEYESFSAAFALPVQWDLPQAVYRLSPPGEEGWLLLLTPVQPAADRRAVLQAVFHTRKAA